jgi:Domain of unknown function (DUF4389)
MDPEEPPKDHVEDREAQESSDYDPPPEFEATIGNKATWQRLLYMLVFGMIFSLSVGVCCFVILLQFFWVLFTGETKKEFLTVGRQLAEYTREIGLYMTFNTEERPFPFGKDWPSV